jgi:hypothetical protein
VANELACLEHEQINEAKQDVVRLERQLRAAESLPLTPSTIRLIQELIEVRLRLATHEVEYRDLLARQAYLARDQ